MSRAVWKRAFLFSLVLCLLPFLILTLFSNPSYDDYCHAAKTLELGFVNTQRSFFHTWNGRYFSMAVLSLGPLTSGSFTGYKIFALLIILLTFISIFLFLSVILLPGAALVDRLIAASLITALFSNQMPDITEGYYWMPATVCYQLANILTLIFFVLVAASNGKRQSMRALLLALAFFLVIAITGSSEPSMIFLLLLLSLITIRAFSIRSSNRRVWLAFLAVAIACAVIVILAPGNAVRGSHFPERHRLFFSLGQSLIEAARYTVKWLVNPAFALSTILYVPVADSFSDRTELLRRHFHIRPIHSLLLLLVIIFLGFFAPLWSMGMVGPERTMNQVYFIFLLGWFVNISVWVGYFKERRGLEIPSLHAYVYLICLPLIPLALLFSNNTRAAIKDLASGRAFHYDQVMRERRAQFEQCAREGISFCPVTKYEDLPETTSNPYFEIVFRCDEQYWKMRAAAAATPKQ
jgi:hypothetical protein